MATYTAITDAEIDQDSPITQTLMTKYRDNLTASMEGDPTAPKMVSKARDKAILYGSRNSSGNIDFSGLSIYGGVEFELVGLSTSATFGLEIRLDYSINSGSSYSDWRSSANAIASASTSAPVVASGYIDFSTGYARSITSQGNSYDILSTATPPLAVTNLRFIYANQSGNCAVILKPYGAIS